MIAEKIRRLRIEKGLSQQQLAGKEFTRGFISQVENGRCKPSPESLALIAERLGKPVTYFFESTPASASRSAEAHLRLGQKALRQCDIEGAITRFREAIHLSQGVEDLDLLARANAAMGGCLRRSTDPSKAFDYYEAAMEIYQTLGNRNGKVSMYYEMANTAFATEEYTLAQRLYEKAIRLSEGLKSVQEIHLRSRLYLGTVMYRLGRVTEAIPVLRATVDEASLTVHKPILGDAAMGLGWLLYRSDRLEEALMWTQKAEQTFRQTGSATLYEAIHNIAIMETAMGHWEHSYALLMQCLAAYQERGARRRQASILEDIALYWMHKGNPQRARGHLCEALNLLEETDDGLLRGRVFRQLARIETAEGNTERARDYLFLSHELFRRLKASAEAADTVIQLKSLEQCHPTSPT